MNQLEKIMSALDLSEAEARQVLQDDKLIEQGHDLYPLTTDQKKVEKKMRQADRSPTVYKFKPRERKANDSKRKLLQTLIDSLIENQLIDDNTLHIENVEREFTFCAEGAKYKVVLSAPRK